MGEALSVMNSRRCRSGSARIPAGAQRAARGRRHAPLRMRRADRLSPAADGGRAAGDRRAGAAHSENLFVDEGAGRSARRGNRPIGRRAAARRRRAAVDGEIHARAARRSARARRGGAARRAQRRDLRSRRAFRPVLRAGPVEPDRLHHRRQRGGELRRRALPEVRPHACTTCSRVRGFTIDGEPSSSAARRSTAPGYDLLALAIGSEGMLAVATEVTVKLLPKPQCARVIMASFDDVEKAGAAVADDHRRRHRPGGPGDDGPPGDARGRAVRARRLRPRGSRDPAVRIRRHARRRSRTRSRACKTVLARAGATRMSGVARRGRAAALLVGAQGGVSRRRPHLARLLLHGRHHPAQAPRRGADLHRRDGEKVRPCAARTCSTRATATCIR